MVARGTMLAMNQDKDAAAGDADLREELDRLSRASVTVLGDVALERRVHGRADGEPNVLMLGEEEAEPSAGAGVVRVLARLRVSTAFICVLGDDLPGAQLTALIGAQPNVEPWLLVDGARSTTTGTSYLDDGREVLRTVRRDLRPMQPGLRERMLRIVGDAMTATSLTVLTERGDGTLDGPLIGQVLGHARQIGRRVIADVERGCEALGRFAGCDAAVGMTRAGRPVADEAGALRRAHALPCVLLFDGAGGLAIADADGEEFLTGAGWADPAGDYPRVVASFAAAIAVGREPRVAGRIASRATSSGALK